MHTFFSKVEGVLGRVRLWYWLASVLATLATSGLFGWLAQRVTIIAAYGYAAVILTGVAFACLTMLAISAAAVAWSRLFASPLDPPKSDAAKTKETRPHLSDAIVVSGDDGRIPSFRARFARNGRDAAFYIEYSLFFGGVGGGWTVPITIPIQTVSRFTQGETISIPLMKVVETREGQRWQFGEEMKNGFPVHMIGGGHIYRGRVKFLSQDDVAQYCYFVAQSHEEMSRMPSVLGEHMFSHLWEWEGKIPPNGIVASLFTRSN